MEGGRYMTGKRINECRFGKHLDSIQEIQNVYQASSISSRFVQGTPPNAERMFTPQHHRGRPAPSPNFNNYQLVANLIPVLSPSDSPLPM